jgi:trk system potassium uptake protein TrkA
MRFCIIGLGSFGTHLARQLRRDGHEVVGVDNNPDHVSALREEIDFLVTADCSDIGAFQDIPVADCDAVIVAIGEDFEASLSIAANVQLLGPKRIICRIINPLHARLLKLLKIDELIIPESMAAAWLARSLRASGVLNSFPVGGGHEIVEIDVPPGLVGKSLHEVDLRGNYVLNLVTVLKRKSAISLSSAPPQIDRIIGVPAPERAFEPGDILLVFGTEKNVRRLLNDYGSR